MPEPSQGPVRNTLGADLLGPRDTLDFYDCQTVDLPDPIDPLEAWRRMATEPTPLLRLAFRIRDALSTPFGVTPIGEVAGRWPEDPQPGDHLDFFLIEARDQERLTLTARDSHLDVMTCITSQAGTVGVTASVITHNRFGKVYMLPVGPAHPLIIRRLFTTLKRSLAAEEQNR